MKLEIPLSDSLTLYGHPLSAPTYKVALGLSLLGKSFHFRFVDLAARAHKTPEFLAISRYGQVPALVVENGPSLVQSAAILEWLSEQEGRFGGADAGERQAIREWLLWDADRLAPGLFRSRAIVRGRLVVEAPVAAYFRQAAEDGLTVLEGLLQERPWLVGAAPSIADIAVYGTLLAAEGGGFDLPGRWPAAAALLARVAALPGWIPADALPAEDRLIAATVPA